MSHRASPAPAESRPRGCTSFRLRQLNRRISQHYDAELAKAGLKTTQYSLLSHVLRLGPVRPGDLAQAMTLDASTLTRNLQPLVAAGWVRIDAGADARSRSVTITESGRAKQAEGYRRWRSAQDGIARQLGADRVLALHTLVDECLATLTPLPDGENDE
jgi:DNA-binding MarR family transcriptional regulator